MTLLVSGTGPSGVAPGGNAMCGGIMRRSMEGTGSGVPPAYLNKAWLVLDSTVGAITACRTRGATTPAIGPPATVAAADVVASEVPPGTRPVEVDIFAVIWSMAAMAISWSFNKAEI